MSRSFAVAIALTFVVAAPALSAQRESESVTVQHKSRWLVADGRLTPALAGDATKWLDARERFIRKSAERWSALAPALPVVYHLDADFVTAASDRESTEVVEDCRGRELCGVATNELPEAWERADLRALFTPATAPFRLREAYAVALLGRFEGEDVDDWSADLVRAGLAQEPLDAQSDERVAIPLLASYFRIVNAHQSLQFGEARARLAATTEEEQARRIATLRARRVRHSTPRAAPLHGATVSLVNRVESSMMSAGSLEELRRLRGVGYDAISLISYAGQTGTSGTQIRRTLNHPAESDLAISLASIRAHRLGMRVMLQPQLWTGWPNDPAAIDAGGRWDLWFDSYEHYLVHAALLARANDAEWLAIGTELSRSEALAAQWGRLITIVRAIFPGRITYAANVEAFERTPFWTSLDAIGVDAFFPLSQNAGARDDELRDGARAAVARLEAVAKKYGKPVILTELGYPSTPGSWIEPSNERRGHGAAPADQARAFAAMLEAVRRSRAIDGWFIWKYESDPTVHDAEGYLPKGKPAEATIRRMIGGT